MIHIHLEGEHERSDTNMSGHLLRLGLLKQRSVRGLSMVSYP
jgi:hypothetical protein